MQRGVVTVGVDLAKNVFQVHAIDADGKVLIRRQLRGAEVLKFFCYVAIVPDRYGSMCVGPSLGPRASRSRSHRALDAPSVTALMKLLHEEQQKLPKHAQSALQTIGAQLRSLASEIQRLEAQILAWHRADDTSRRLATIPGIGPITASAIVAAVSDASLFSSGRQFAAWLDLTPRANNSGGRERLGGISKQGDGYLRKLLVVGATAVMRMARKEVYAAAAA